MRLSMLIMLLFLGVRLLASPTTLSPYFRVDQLGYPAESVKIAFFSKPLVGFNAGESATPGSTFELRDWNTDAIVFSGSITSWNDGQVHEQSGDQVWWMDFSDFSTPGSYYLYDPSLDWGSYRFDIDASVYAEVLQTAVRMYYYQRCGTEKPAAYAGTWSDGASHVGPNQDLACRSILAPNDPSSAKELAGGWYDAGDYNKYVNFTYGTLHQLLFAYAENPTVWLDDYNLPESGNGIPDILDEIRWELDWLKKMQLADGSVLSKVSSMAFSGASPPSSDPVERFYGPAIASSTAVLASVFAHASLVFSESGYSDLQNEAIDLLNRAELAWNWLLANPSFSNYDNAGFQTANPEMTEETQHEVRIGAAALLYLKTGNQDYQDYVADAYTTVRPYQWGYWYPFGGPIQDILIFYASQNSPPTAIKQAIRDNFYQSATQGNQELLPAYWEQVDAYGAYLKDQDYVWGSNQTKATAGNLIYLLQQYQFNPAFEQDYQAAAAGFLHYFHGANPLGLVFLSNMEVFGAESSVSQIYHGWFEEGTLYDDATTGVGPAPGYLTGGCNPSYQPDPAYTGPYLSPPLDQPILKSYKDWNTDWPENSWELTEPAIYYQAAYIRLLSKFTKVPDVNSVVHRIDRQTAEVYPNPGARHFTVQFSDQVPLKGIRVYDQQGAVMQVPILAQGKNCWVIDLSQVNPGVYWVMDLSGKASAPLIKQ